MSCSTSPRPWISPTFLEATRTQREGPYDISLVEGSISTAHEMERIREIRRDSRLLITIGACATAGGIQALRNTQDHDSLRASVYPSPQFIDALATSTPIADHVPVDYELRGCPIDKRQLIEAITALLKGRKPTCPTTASARNASSQARPASW